MAEEEGKVRDGATALAEALRRALDGPRRSHADSIGVLSDALDGFNMKRLRLKLLRFGIDLGSQFGEVAMALQSAIVAERGDRPDVAAGPRTVWKRRATRSQPTSTRRCRRRGAPSPAPPRATDRSAPPSRTW